MTANAQGAAKRVSRIPLRAPEDMGPEELAAYNAKPEARINISRLFAVAETLAPHIRDTNMAMATSITVPSLERELVTLATLHLERGEYELAQHREVAKMMGIPQEKLEAIAGERYSDPVFNERERALLAFTRQVVKAVRVDEAAFNAVAAFYDGRQILETTFVIGNYMLLARMTEVAELEVDSVLGANFWKDKPQT